MSKKSKKGAAKHAPGIPTPGPHQALFSAAERDGIITRIALDVPWDMRHAFAAMLHVLGHLPDEVTPDGLSRALMMVQECGACPYCHPEGLASPPRSKTEVN